MTPNWKAAVIIPIYGVIFGKTIGNLEPRGDHIYGYPHCFEIIFQLTSINIMLCPECIFVGILHYQMVKIKMLFE